MDPSANALEENRRLRRTMRDLVALSTLPAVWIGLGLEGIARSLADVLFNILSLDLLYVRLAGLRGQGVIEAVRGKHRHDPAQDEVVKAAVAPLLKSDRTEPPASIPNPFGSGTLHVAVTRFGVSDDYGVVVAGSRNAGFPTEQDRLLLGVGANQTAIVVQRRRAEDAMQEQREWLRVTLASIGDAVIATDTAGRVTFLNPVAQDLTGWNDEAQGQPLEQVFRIVHEQTRQPVENPVAKVLREGRIVGLGNHTILIARNGAERPIDDSAAPIRGATGETIGVVLIFRDVTEQRRGETELRASEARKSAILETALDCIVTCDQDGVIVEFNPAAERTFGYSRIDVVGREMADLIIPPSLRQAHRRGMTRNLASGEERLLNKRIEMLAQRADGTELPVELAITRIRSDGPPLFTAYLRDISERKRQERQRNARVAVTQVLAQAPSIREAATGALAAVCENLGWDRGLFWTPGANGDVLHCLASWRQPGVGQTELEASSRQGLRRGEGLAGHVWASGKPHWIRDVTQEAGSSRAALAAQEELHGAFGCPVLLGGETLAVIELYCQQVREPDADLLEIMAAIAGQIGQLMERKRAEQERDRFFAVGTDLLVVFGFDGYFKRVNPAWERVLGWTVAELAGQPWLSLVHPDDRQATAAEGERLMRSEEIGSFENRYCSKAGDYRWLSWKVKPYPDERLLYGGATDITERKRGEEALREADRRKDEFLATLAHELRNPLAPLRNAVQVLKMPRLDTATVERAREMMERQVHHLVRLVDDLLDVSRVMGGKIVLRKELVELAGVVARAVETAQPLIEAQQHQLTLHLPSETLLLDVDPVRLAQIIGNLLTNAAKYTEAKGRIWLTAQREGDQAVLGIRDSGIGIAPDMLPHVFDLFVQADHAATRSQGGLGIGLTLVKNLVEMHHGTVAAHSAGLGKGSEFVVRLPLSKRGREAARESNNSEQREARPLAGHRLLVVDDNRDAAESLALLLRLQGHEVRVVHDGPAALELVTDYRPEMIFLDIGMPGMDGYEVARRLRRLPGLEKVSLAALTGWGQQEDRRRSQQAGFDHHLVKPVEPKALEALLADLKR